MAYRTRNGRRVQLPRASTNGIQYLIKIDGTKAIFECKEDKHRFTVDYLKGPKSTGAKAPVIVMAGVSSVKILQMV